jgi:hypothetical protein
MAFSQIEKEGLFTTLDKVKIIEEHKIYTWKRDLTNILNSKTVKLFKFFAGKKVQYILDTAEQIVGLIVFIQALGGWEEFKKVIVKIIQLGGIEQTMQQLEPTKKTEKKQ